MLRRMLSVCILVGILLHPGVARADALDTVLNILWTAGLIDKSVVDAKPLVACLVNGNSVQSCGEQLAGDYADQTATDVMASDPKIVLAVDVMRSINQGDWIKVLETTSTDLLMQIACSAGIPGGGPVKSFICSGVFGEVAKKTKPVVRQVLIAVQSGSIDDWLMVVGMTGPSFACEIIPSSVPGKDLVCSTLAEVLGEAAEAVADAADAVYGSAAAVGEWISGQSKHMPVEQYYSLYWKPWYHYGTLLQVKNSSSWGDLLKEIRDPCEDYFDSHTMSQDNAQDTCDDMRNRFSKEVATMRKAIEIAPNAYYHAVAEPLAGVWAINDYGADDTTAVHRNFIVNGCAADLRAKFPFPEPDPRRCEYLRDQLKDLGGMFAAAADSLYSQCVSQQARQTPNPSLWEYLCEPVGDSFEQAFKVEKSLLEQRLMGLVSSGNCRFPPGWKAPGVKLSCVGSSGYDKCMDVLQAAHPEQRCSADLSTMAEEIIAEIGGKRCRYSVSEGRITCSRPWKWEKCESVLFDYRNSMPIIDDQLQCDYFDTRFKPEVEKAAKIIAALNDEPSDTAPESSSNGEGETSLSLKPTVRQLSVKPDRLQLSASPALQIQLPPNCATTWDPLAIHCDRPEVLLELSKRLPGASLPLCSTTPDPDRNGADHPCYSGVYPIAMPSDKPQTIPLPEPEKIMLPGDEPGKTAKGSGLAVQQALPLQKAVQTTRPDYRVGSSLNVAGKPVNWGRAVTLNAAELEPGLRGTCVVEIRYSIDNLGDVMSPAATTKRWTVTGQPPVEEFLGRIQPRGRRAEAVSLSVPAGTSTLALNVDPGNKVEEMNENNNSATFVVRLNGTCGASRPRLKATPPASSPTVQTRPMKSLSVTPSK